MDNKIYERVMEDINELFGRVFYYNSELLAKCNDLNYQPTFDEIYDFYITSQAMTFLKNFYCNHVESPATLLNIRCIYEGISIKEAYRKGQLDEFNLELLKKQDALIEYKQYKNFKEIYENFMIPKDIEEKYNESVLFYKNTLCSMTDDEVMKIINSPIPFLCDSKLSYRQIIKDNLGEDVAKYYSFLSTMIHPNSNNPIDSKGLVFILMNAFALLKSEYKDLPKGAGDLRYYLMIVTSSKSAEEFNDLIKAECTQFEKVEADFEKNFGKNYVTDTFFKVSMTIQEMMLDAVFGFTEQVKGKWKIMLEVLAGFYEVYLNNDNVADSFNLLEFHSELSKARAFGANEDAAEILDSAYKTYKNKYPNGIDFDLFSKKFISTCGFTIDEKGKVKTITQIVNQLCDLFEDDKLIEVLKLNYVEAQMVSHANGYLWYANTGAWADIDNVFANFNLLISFICFYMSNLFKDSYAHTKEYKDKKTSNVLKQAGTFIKNNTEKIMENLKKRQLLNNILI